MLSQLKRVTVTSWSDVFGIKTLVLNLQAFIWNSAIWATLLQYRHLPSKTLKFIEFYFSLKLFNAIRLRQFFILPLNPHALHALREFLVATTRFHSTVRIIGVIATQSFPVDTLPSVRLVLRVVLTLLNNLKLFKATIMFFTTTVGRIFRSRVRAIIRPRSTVTTIIDKRG